MFTANNTSLVKNTTHKVVIPFYVYAAVAFLTATILLSFSTSAFTTHYFHPRTLAITHTMALGWGTMIILGASHQLVPVLIEARLYSNLLAYLSFVLAGIGIPMLVYAFFTFRFDAIALSGAVLINAAIVCYLLNLGLSITKGKKENVHAVYVFTAAVWLLATTIIGMLLVFNFTYSIFPNGSLHYLSLHAHLGIAGWFLLLVIGVGSRLIPMFLISKYDAPKKLWSIYFLINGALASFIFIFLFSSYSFLNIIPITALFLSLILFAQYCYKAYGQRLRKKVDEQLKISLLSVLMMVVPLFILVLIIGAMLFSFAHSPIVLAYGFFIFFGWITAIIFGMTFKTLPFIVWNKLYHNKASGGKTPNPKDLFSSTLFNAMSLFYLAGLLLFITGIFMKNNIVLQSATFLLIATAVLYNWNILKMLLQKPLMQ